MTITSTKSWKHYMLICRALEYNDIPYVRNDDKLCIKCTISGKEYEQKFLFSVDSSKMLINLFSPLPLCVSDEQAGDIALALCMINNKLSHGSFYLDMDDHLLYFRMTTSFYETNLNGMIFEYMLSASADTIDEYVSVLSKSVSCNCEIR